MSAAELGRKLLEAIPFNQFLELKIEEISPERGVVLLPDREPLRNHIGTQHAGALCSAAEAASGAAILGALGGRLAEVTPLAKKAEIAYLRIARGPITCTATVRGSIADVFAALDAAGKAECAVDVALTDGSGTQVTSMTVAWHLRKNG
jgi:acyl-coenzyme A thioesterase PaaI-like protein